PETLDVTVPVHLTAKETKAYADMKEQLAAQIAKGVSVSATSMLTQRIRLRQITSGHVPSDDGEMQIIGDSKVKAVQSIVNDSLVGEKRIVVFAFFSTEIAMLRKAFEDKDGTTEVQVIEGSTPTDERMRLRRRIGPDDPQRMVMIAQIKTMSLAVNELITANHAIFASMSEQRDDMVQARDRLNRNGHTRPITFWYCAAPGTVDDLTKKTHGARGDLEAAMLHHIRRSLRFFFSFLSPVPKGTGREKSKRKERKQGLTSPNTRQFLIVRHCLTKRDGGEIMTTHFASYSQINTHRACPQRWQYGAIQRLEEDRPEGDAAVELEFGIWWHALRAADSIDRGRKHGSLKQIPETLRTVDDGPEISTAYNETETLAERVLGAAERW